MGSCKGHLLRADPLDFARVQNSGTYLPQEVTVAETEKANRTWREIAEEVSRESDPEKLQKLSMELERALD